MTDMEYTLDERVIKAPDPEPLRALLAAATPGPWMVLPGYWGARTLAVMRHQTQTLSVGLPEDGEPWDRYEANAALIVAAVNSLPALLDTLDALRAENARLKEAGERLIEAALVHRDGPLADCVPWLNALCDWRKPALGDRQ